MIEKDLVVENDDELVNLLDEYIQLKGNKFVIMSMDDRITLFLSLIKDCDYSKDSFKKVSDFKRLFFPKNKISKLGVTNLDYNLATFVVGDSITKENKLIVLYSEKGVNNKKISEKNTTAFEVSFKDHTTKQIKINELKYKIICNRYRMCKGSKFDKVEEQSAENSTLQEVFEEYLTLTTSRQA